MCDPVSLAVGAIGGALVGSSMSRKGGAAPAAATSTAAEDQAAADAAATQSANAKIAERQRRRRSQGGLTATLGAGQDPLGAKTDPNGYKGLTGQAAPMGYVTAGRASSGNSMPGSQAGGSGYYGGYKPARV